MEEQRWVEHLPCHPDLFSNFFGFSVLSKNTTGAVMQLAVAKAQQD